MLGVLSIQDVKYKKIDKRCIYILLFTLFLNWVYMFIYLKKEFSFLSILFGAVLGFQFCLFSVLSNQNIGLGDSVTVLIIGLYKGITFLFLCLCISFILASVVSFFFIILKIIKKEDKICFIPFLFVGFCIVELMNEFLEMRLL